MKNTKRWLSLLVALAMALSCMAALAETADDNKLSLQPGDALDGFTVLEVYDSAMLNSTIYTFNHDVSGAKLVYVKNDDPELAFSIGYKTPYVDETDTNHVFEHSILAGSEKYPSKDIFFDMANRAYSTYINASTTETTTRYPLSSMSEDQLMKLMDVYMSCMVAPLILEDERFFRREAIRFELNDPEGEIGINGTVFAEDRGFLTSNSMANQDAMRKALHPGEIAANTIGRANHHYKDLTFEHLLQTYERCYHFDNSMIFLYGNLDLDRFLSFLDQEYLSKYPAQGTDLSPWIDDPSPEGFVDMTCPFPAYEGDAVENASIISYAIDLDGISAVELSQYDLLSDLLNLTGSPLYNARLERGIENPIMAYINSTDAKPYFYFYMPYANPDQKDELKAVAEEALSRVARDGVDPEMVALLLKSAERSAKLIRDNTNVGVNIMPMFLVDWARTGSLNYYRTYEQALKSLTADGQQQLIRGMALDLLTPRRSALVASVPTPGMAEAYDQELNQYLADMKASMTPEEIENMVAETAAFNEWNASEQSNNDFLISPKDLPDPTQPTFTKENVDGVTVYKGATSLEGVGQYAVYFDLSGMSREEMEYLMLTSNYIGQMGTDAHSVEELTLLTGEYLAGVYASKLYPTSAAGENHRPMYALNWVSLTEDFEKSLDLVLELYTRTNFHDTDMLSYLTSVNAENWDMSRQNGGSIADLAAHANAGLRSDTNKFMLDVDGQDAYYLIADAAKRVGTEEGFADTLADQYENAVRKAFTRDNLILMVAAPEDELDGIVEKAVAVLNALPEKTGADAEYALPEVPKALAIGIEDSMNNTRMVGDFMADEDFVGRYLPFVFALNDLYTVPTFRFKLGAYSAGSMSQWGQGCLMNYVASDPNVKKTVDALRAIPEAVKDMTLTEETLNGYILKTYGSVTGPMGKLTEMLNAMEYDLLGMDAERVMAIKSDVRNATLDIQAEAAEHIARIVENSAICMVGNEALLRADADCFDEVISYRHGD